MEFTIGRIPESDDITRSRRRTLAVKRLTVSSEKNIFYQNMKQNSFIYTLLCSFIVLRKVVCRHWQSVTTPLHSVYVCYYDIQFVNMEA